MTRRWRHTLLAPAAAAILLAGGCAFDPAQIPVPGTGISEPTYRVHIQFSNALNLPARAQVVANGARVGTVVGVRVVDSTDPAVHGGYVIVDADIAESVRLPMKTTAELRQNTLLGDIHLALTTPPDGFGELLHADAVIPLSQTHPPMQIEDAMAGMATFVQGGAISQFQDIVNRLNAVLPADPRDTARIAGVLSANAIDVANNLDQAEAFLNGLSAVSGAVDDNSGDLAELLTKPAVQQVTDSVNSIVSTIGVVGALGGVAHSLAWLAPLAQSGDAAARAFAPLLFTGRPLDLGAPSNLNALVALLRDKIIPMVEHGPAVNVTGISVNGLSADDQIARIIQSLHMIGVVR
ncbi:MlaD family protein [Nocardia sp. NPDC006630]|uniref:MlaD family protein n=1 Tax=Nocardia sp. NPDC006630 TaxID=3157181 RepID=UPI0033A6ADF6